MANFEKKSRLAFLLSLFLLPACGRDGEEKGVSFAAPQVDFGAVYGSKTQALTIVNQSSRLVSIRSVQADCSCASFLSPTSFDIPPRSEHRLQVQMHGAPGAGEIGSQLFALTNTGQRLGCYVSGVAVSSEGLAFLNSPSMYSDTDGTVSGVAIIARDKLKRVEPEITSSLEKLNISGGKWMPLESHLELECKNYELSADQLQGSGSFVLHLGGGGQGSDLKRKINWYAATTLKSNKGFWFIGTSGRETVLENTFYLHSADQIEFQSFEGGDFEQKIEKVADKSDLLSITVRGKITTPGLVDKSLTWTSGGTVIATIECLAFMTD